MKARSGEEWVLKDVRDVSFFLFFVTEPLMQLHSFVKYKLPSKGTFTQSEMNAKASIF